MIIKLLNEVANAQRVKVQRIPYLLIRDCAKSVGCGAGERFVLVLKYEGVAKGAAGQDHFGVAGAQADDYIQKRILQDQSMSFVMPMCMTQSIIVVALLEA